MRARMSKRFREEVDEKRKGRSRREDEKEVSRKKRMVRTSMRTDVYMYRDGGLA